MEDKFITDCRKYFGKTPEYILYKINHLEKRIENMEDRINARDPIIGGAVLRMESVIECLLEKKFINNKSISLKSSSVMGRIKE